MKFSYISTWEEMGIEYKLADKMITSASFGNAQAAQNLFNDPQSEKALLSKNFRKIEKSLAITAFLC